MAIDTGDEIVQDFLVESKEILESLGEQLVDLEQRPEDRELLNSVFRGFHTIKGGAGFLDLTGLVDVCHRTEDLFNLLRQGDLQVTPNLMDVVLRALDVVNEMFSTLESGADPKAPDPVLLQQLVDLQHPDDEPSSAPAPAATAEAPEASASEEAAPANSDDISDDEFEALLDAMGGNKSKTGAAETDVSDEEFENILDQLHGEKKPEPVAEKPKQAPVPPTGDRISDDEFDALLDELHGSGKGPTATDHLSPASAPAKPAAAASAGQTIGERISEDEFDALLDELHGKGRGPTETGAGAAPAPAPVAASAPVAAPAKPKAAPAASPTPKPAAPVAEKASDGGGGGGGSGGGSSGGGGSGGGGGRESGPKAETTVRVDTARLDDIMNLVGELVLVRNRLTTIRQEVDGDNMKQGTTEALNQAVSDLELVTSDLQAAVMKTRMQPIKKVFGRFPRVVRDLARSLNKEIELELRGEETDLDKNLVEALADPLVHLVRNSVDHGVEAPEDRVMAGKPRTGRIILGAEQEGDHILLTISDDGGGMDPDKLRKKAVEKGLMDHESASRLDNRDCFNLIFMPGFSTKAEISDISGRGVGMDVVKTRISQLNGTIDIDSDLGEGTTISIKVPLTLAILPTLMVTLCGRKFALPMSVVREIFELDAGRTNMVDGQLVVMVRDKAMPIFFLERWLKDIDVDLIGRHKRTHAKVYDENGDEVAEEERQVVTVVIGNVTVGFVVDEVIGLEEVVIKPLGAMLQGLPGLAGSTITGDGRIALIVDIPSLLKQYSKKM